METQELNIEYINIRDIYGILIQLPNSLFSYLSLYYQCGYNGDYQCTYKISLN